MSLKILIGRVIFEFRKFSFKNFQDFSHIGSVLSFLRFQNQNFGTWKWSNVYSMTRLYCKHASQDDDEHCSLALKNATKAQSVLSSFWHRWHCKTAKNNRYLILISALCEIMIIHLFLLLTIIDRVEPGRNEKHAAAQKIRGTIEPRGTKRRGKREEIEDTQRKS